MLSTQVGVVLMGLVVLGVGVALVLRALRPRQTSAPKGAPLSSAAGHRAVEQARVQVHQAGEADRREVGAALAKADPVQGLVDLRAARRRREP